MKDGRRRGTKRDEGGRSKPFVLFVFFVLFATPLSAQRSRDLNAAVELERVGRHAEAAERYVAVLRADTANIPALFGLERTLLSAGGLERLLPFVAAAIERRPGDASLRGLELRTLISLGRVDQAAAAAERWIEAQPRSLEPYRDWAFAAAQRGDLDEARRVLELGRRRLGGAALVQELAQVHVVAGQWVEAARHWHGAALAEPGIAASAGVSLAQAPAAVREEILAVLLQDLGDPIARRIAADVLVAWNRPDQAWPLLDGNLPADPRLAATALRRFADRARLLGTPAGARVRGFALERLAGLAPGPAAQQARIEAAQAFADAGDRAGAERMLDRIAGDPAAAPSAAVEAMAALIGVTADAGRVQEAERQLAQWGPRFSQEARGALRERIAWAWIRQGELDRATRALGQDSSVATVAIHGWVALFRGDLAEAAARFRVAGPYSGSRSDATRRTGMLALIQRIEAQRQPALGAAFLTLARGDSAGAVERLETVARDLPPAAGRADLLAYAGQLAAEQSDERADALLRSAIAADSLGPAAPAATLTLAELAWRQGRAAEATARLEHLILTYPESALIPQARRLLDRVRGAVPNS
jgi:tetratricopeptide (TPR) repeat protein